MPSTRLTFAAAVCALTVSLLPVPVSAAEPDEGTQARPQSDPVAPLASPDVSAPAVPPPPPLPPTDPGRAWYGWQVLLTDGAWIACVAATQQEACLAGFALLGPIVHTAHGGPWRGLASLGLRVGLPLVGGLVGAAMANCPPRQPSMTTVTHVDGGTVTSTGQGLDLCGLSELGMGAMIGTGVAIIVDSTVAFTDSARASGGEPAKPVHRPSQRQSHFAVEPRVAVGQNNLALGVGGSF